MVWKKMWRKGVALLASLAMICGACPYLALAVDGVIIDSASIGGNGAKLVYITMDGNRTADVVLANGSVHADNASDALLQRVTQGGNATIVAAVNGGFFNSYYNSGASLNYPDNCPRIYSTVIQDGRLVNGVGETNMLGVTWDGKVYIDHTKYQCTMLLNGRIPLGLWAVNQYFSDPRSISLFTKEFTLPITIPQESVVLTIRDNKVAAVANGGTYSVPAGAELLVYNSQAVKEAKQWNQFPAIGDSAVAVTTAASCKRSADLPAWRNMKTVVAGGRMILQNTYDVTADTSYNAEFDSDSKQSATGVAQRSFAATMQDGRLLLGTANASFKAIAAYLKSIGAVNAISLDGGASSMLYVAGQGYLTSAGRKLASAFVIVDEKVKKIKPPTIEMSTNSTTGMDANEPSSWAVEPINQGKTLGLIPDWLQNAYRTNITRRDFCVLIVTLLEKKSGKAIDSLRGELGAEYPKASPFQDTDDYYIRECAALQIVNGTDGRFRPNDSLSRQEAAAILQRMAKVLGSSSNGGTGKSFTDAGQIESWAMDAVAYVTAVGIMNGEGEAFHPLGLFTREQAYITMVNAYHQI